MPKGIFARKPFSEEWKKNMSEARRKYWKGISKKEKHTRMSLLARSKNKNEDIDNGTGSEKQSN